MFSQDSVNHAPKQSSSMTPVLAYDHNLVETEWQKWWTEKKLFQNACVRLTPDQQKDYLLFAFAYPSGQGLHVGHVESKTALDILARFRRMQGKQVYFPVGWDAFGLPAENYAIKTGIHPAITTKNAIDTFREQIKRLAISYDWANETATNHPEYYKWTQWLFLQLYKQGLAYKDEGMVNWCPSCQTVLANEQVVEGACERCDSVVIQKSLEQWYFKITHYQEELLTGLESVDWPEPTKQQQRNWIGKSQGIIIDYQVVDSPEKIACFTTTPVNFGATFLVISPEHPLVDKIVTTAQRKQVNEYRESIKKRSEFQRLTVTKDKTGVFTGSFVKNHVTGESIPVWISDFVLMNVGTGAVQGCPAHDERDFDFAQKFHLPIKRVVVGTDGDMSDVDSKDKIIAKGMAGKMINSDFLNGMEFSTAMQKTMDYFEEKGWGKRTTNYKLRDWLISRQRYWGAPIPIVYDPQGQPHPVAEKDLPWLLPTDVDFKPTGESPLRSSKEFIERTERLYGQGWRPEFDTMDTFVDSSWYFLRYCDSRNSSQFAHPEKLSQWLPVDLYLIGPEHIVLHLLYSRFFTKFLRDQGLLKVSEPFAKMRHQGMILGPNGKKMSKSKGNVINPDDIINQFGADTLRIYEMFMGPLEADKPWDDRAVAGVNRFLKKLNRLVAGWLGQTSAASADLPQNQSPAVVQFRRLLHKTLNKISADIPALKFNTAIAAFMELANAWEEAVRNSAIQSELSVSDIKVVILMLAPFAPFLAEELNFQVQKKINLTSSKDDLGQYDSVHLASWPEVDSSLLQDDNLTIMVQVNGKIRGQFQMSVADAHSSQAAPKALAQAQAEISVQKWLAGMTIQKKFYVPGKMVSLVVS